MTRILDAKELGALLTLIIKAHDRGPGDENHDTKITRLAEDIGISRAALYNAMQGKLTEVTKALSGFAYLVHGMPARHEERRAMVLAEFLHQFGYALGEKTGGTHDSDT